MEINGKLESMKFSIGNLDKFRYTAEKEETDFWTTVHTSQVISELLDSNHAWCLRHSMAGASGEPKTLKCGCPSSSTLLRQFRRQDVGTSIMLSATFEILL